MKKDALLTRTLAGLLCVLMLLGMVPLTVMADEATTEATRFPASQLSLVQDKKSTLANGVTQDIYTVYDKNGKQVKMFAATIDLSVDTVRFFTSYKDMDNTSYGMSKLTEQVAAFNDKAAAGDAYYRGTVVAGINASYYNMTTGKPSGVFVMNGNDVTGNERSAYFAVLKDGTVKIGKADEYEADRGNIQEALGIYKMLVYDGEIALSESDRNGSQKYPRQTIGITADNKVILLSADGNQEPESAGLTLMEQAQVMIDLGCRWAGHLDGGGSMTYGSKPEGEDDFVIVNKPSDGSERSISNGLLVVSTAAVSRTFDHVSFETETEYATVGTPVSVVASGVSVTGHAADIPADVEYRVVNGTCENGVLTATAVGDVTLVATQNGKEVGSVTIHAVVPDRLVFNNEKMTVPFGKTVTLALTATYGLNEVRFKADDILFTLENSGIGSIDGLSFTAGDGSVTESAVTAKFAGTDITAAAVIALGRGSDVIFDFEDGDTSMFELSYVAYNYVLPDAKVYHVTPATGKVHSGNGAMALDINYGNSLESGYMMTALQYTGDEKTFENATRLGMWIYISDEDVSTWIRYTVYPLVLNDAGEYVMASSSITDTKADGVASTTGFVNRYQEPGWHYLSIDLSKYKGLYLHQGYIVQFYISDRDGAAYDYYYNQHKSYNGRYVMYVDDITVDYSDAVDDREAPVFGDVTYATGSMADAAVLDGQTVTANTVSFSVKAADNMTKSNYTGLDIATAKAYIDGVEVACTVRDGVLSVTDAVLADGLHHVKFSVCDKQGNYASVIRTIRVQADSGKATVKVVAHDPSLDRILLGSVWYADIVATDAEKVQSVVVDIDLNNMSRWELDHMIVAAGFTATYSVQEDENIATVIITRTGHSAATGETVLASLPIRTWELKMGYTYESGTKKGSTAYTYAQFKSMKEFWPIDISMEIDRGLVTFTDGTTGTFSGEGPQVDTEMYAMAKDMISTAEGKAYYDAWNGGHIHTAHAVDDKAATCTEDGYTGRTYCDVCHSVVDWGTVLPATGHRYENTDGVMKCACGELLNGTQDGKYYVDGIAAAGWIGDFFYEDGVAATGIRPVDGFYYDFGEEGKSRGKYTGLLQLDGKWHYSKLGELTGGWVQIEEDWYFFKWNSKEAAQGEYTVQITSTERVTFLFNEQGMTKGAWHRASDGGLRYYYGPNRYLARNHGYLAFYEVDGKTYNFDENGNVTYGEIQVLQDAASLRKLVYRFDTDGSVLGRISDEGFVTDSEGDLYYIGGNGEISFGTPGLVKIGDAIYDVKWSGKFSKEEYREVTTGLANGLLTPGIYYFGADGKVLLSSFTGVKADESGVLYYYVDGEVQIGKPGLVKADGSVYDVKWSGKVAADEYRDITPDRSNGLLADGKYYFGSDGKLQKLFTGVKADGNGVLYYYVNGLIMTGKPGLIEIDGVIYDVKWSGKVAVNEYRDVTADRSNGLLAEGKYYFGADGRLQALFTGVKAGDDGILYYYVNGIVKTGTPGLIEIDGVIYDVKWSGKVAADEYRDVTDERSNGLLENGKYYFGADGRLVRE